MNNSGDNFSGNTTLTGGTLQLGDGTNTGLAGTGSLSVATTTTLILDEPGTSTAPTAIVNNLNGAGAVINDAGVAAGSGAVILSGNNNITGTITINGGQFQLGSSTLGNPAQITVASGGQFDFGIASGLVISSPLSIAGTGYTDSNGPTGALRFGASSNTWKGTISVAAGGASISGVNGSGTISGSILGGPVEFGTLVGASPVVITLTGSNSYTNTTIDTDATVIVGSGGTAGTLGTGTNDVVNGILAFNRSDTTSFAGTITGIGTLIVQGGGILNLTSNANVTIANVYISDNLGNTASNGTLNVQAGSTLNDAGVFSVGNVAGITGTVNQFGGAVNLTGTVGLQLLNSAYATPAAGYGSLFTPLIDFGAGTEMILGDGSVLDRAGSTGNGQAGDPFYSLFQSQTPTLGELPNGPDNFGAIFTGKILIPTTDSYTFTTRSDDGSVLFIDGQEMVNNNFNQGMTNRSGTIELTAGFHTILIGYYQGGGGLGLQASWAEGNGARAIIPSSVLYNDLASPGNYVSGGLQGAFYELTAASIANYNIPLTTFNDLLIGNAAGETSSYNLSGGTFNATSSDLIVGDNGNGSFNQSGGIANLQGFRLTNANVKGTLDLTGGTLNLAADGIYSGSAPSTPLAEFGGGTLQAVSTFSITVPTILTGSGQQNINTQGNTITLSGVVSGTGGIDKLGSGTLSLSNSNSYAGGTTINAGTIASASSSSLGTGTITESGGILQLAGAPSLTAYPNNVVVPAGDTGTTALVVSGSTATYFLGSLTIGNGGTFVVTAMPGSPPPASFGLTMGQVALAGTDTIDIINGTSLTGSLTLGGFNDFSTAATLNTGGSGTVVLNSAAISLVSTSEVDVTAGTLISGNASALGSAAAVVTNGTLRGFGSMGTLSDTGGIVAPSVGFGSTGIFNTGTASFSTSGTYTVTSNGTTAGSYSQINAAGVVNLGNATLTLVLGYTPNLGDSYTILTSTNPIQGAFAGLAQGSLIAVGNLTFQISYLNDAVTLTNVYETAVELGTSDNTAVYGEGLIFTADILSAQNAAAPGTITFMADGIVLATVPIGNGGSLGEATFFTSSLAVGNYTITAVYTPAAGSGFLGSTTTIDQSISQDPAIAALSSSENPSNYGDTVTFTVTVTPDAPGSGPPTGSVTFYDGSTALGTESLTAGLATYTTSNLAIGNHTISAIYNGDTNFTNDPNSSPLIQVVNGTSNAPTVANVLINNGQLQQSMVTSIQVTFSEPVDVSTAQMAFSLTRVGLPNNTPGDDATIGTITATPTTSGSTAAVFILTFSGVNTEAASLGDGNWTLNIDNTKVASDGVQMTAKYQQTNIKRLFGDYYGSGEVDSVDLGVFGTTFGYEYPSPAFIAAFDSDGNGIIDSIDLDRLGINYGLTI